MKISIRPAPYVWGVYLAAFFIFMFAPLVVVAVFAFNAGTFPAPPWKGFTLEWFTALNALGSGKPGVLQDSGMLRAIGNSLFVGLVVAVISVAVGTANAFLLERFNFRGKNLLSVAVIWPLVIPGVILGTSILSFASDVAGLLETATGQDMDWLRPSLPLVIMGQLSFTITLATLVIAARLRRFDPTLEEAAADLGASNGRVLTRITLPFLRPAMIGAGFVCFLMSVENFNTTLMLVGSQPTLPIYMFGQLRDGATPAINAVSLLLMSVTLIGIIALASGNRRQP